MCICLFPSPSKHQVPRCLKSEVIDPFCSWWFAAQKAEEGIERQDGCLNSAYLKPSSVQWKYCCLIFPGLMLKPKPKPGLSFCSFTDNMHHRSKNMPSKTFKAQIHISNSFKANVTFDLHLCWPNTPIPCCPNCKQTEMRPQTGIWGECESGPGDLLWKETASSKRDCEPKGT